MWYGYLLVLGCLHLHATTPSVEARPLTEWQQPPRPPPSLLQQMHNQNYLYKTATSNGYQVDGAERDLDLDAGLNEGDESAEDPEASRLGFDIEENPSLEDGTDSIDLSTPNFMSSKNVARKRAFTLLSRWHPFSTYSRNVPSIREQNRQIFNDLDIETRAMLRPVGQPLRWG